MNNSSIAPCGVICDICLGFQRTKNRCAGCNYPGNRPYHCTVCSIKTCVEKEGDATRLCHDCSKFPCRRIKDLNKRYVTRYGESPIENLQKIKETGPNTFISDEQEKWKCVNCGQLLCVHKEVCLACGAKNGYFPLTSQNN